MLSSHDLILREGYPSFMDLPWEIPLIDWQAVCNRLEEVPRGLSRHPVVFVNYGGQLFALKELPPGLARKEFGLLCQMDELHLPAVTPVGYAQVLSSGQRKSSVLITRYLEFSLPYRSLFMRSDLDRYRQHMLDAMAGLLVQLHLAGVFWGDCSLSNALFKRDAGTLQAYLVDAETAEVHPPRLDPTLRYHDLEIMIETIDGDIRDLLDTGALATHKIPVFETGANIRQRYLNLWEATTQEQIIFPEERYRIQERIRTLNALGFSVGGLELQATETGDKLRLRVMITDRNFHHDRLLSLTGVEAEEMQARLMMNEIQEVKARLSQANNRSTPLSVAAFYWLEHIYQPVVQQFELLSTEQHPEGRNLDKPEFYCQVLEHKWYLSERAHHDVGHQTAVEDYLKLFG